MADRSPTSRSDYVEIERAEYAYLNEKAERLEEIERVFNEGWLPEIPGERAGLRLRAIYGLRALIEPPKEPSS